MPDHLPNVVGLRAELNVDLVRRRMAALELDAQGLAALIGVEVRSVRRWLAGDVPKALYLARLAVLFSAGAAPIYVELPGDPASSLLRYRRPRARCADPDGQAAAAAP